LTCINGLAMTPEVHDFHLPAAGGVAGIHAGTGPPLLLVHSVNAAASVAEMRPLFELWQNRRSVFAADLPGFGASNRARRVYTPRLMTDALLATVEHIRSVCGTAPVDALALSTGCEFLARAASERPGHFGRLALVSPTGFRGLKAWRGAPGSTRFMPTLHRVLSQPLWAGALFRGLTRPRVVRYFLEKTWGSKAIDEQMWRASVQAARAPGAEHAPLYFLSGGLFSADILSVYESLTQPVWASHGTRGDFTDYRGLVHLHGRPHWQFTTYECGALPYFEQPARFDQAFTDFLAGPPLQQA
jgi:pimeloyl-ACP methyl ester carboxylesterase